MTIEKLRAVYEAQPFRPFNIHVADGRKIHVASREFFMTTPGGRTVVVCEPDDTMHILDLLLITDLEIPATANGHGKRRRA